MTSSRARVHYLLLACLVLLVLLAVRGDAIALGSTPVTVTNPADIAKAEGVQTPVSIDLSTKIVGGTPVASTFSVPSNQRLIIEYASGRCFVITASFGTVELEIDSGNTSSFAIFNVGPLNGAQVGAFANFGHTVKIYAPPGSSLQLNIDFSFGPGANIGECDVFLSGQLVDVP